MTHLKRFIPNRVWRALSEQYHSLRHSDLIRDQLPAVISFQTEDRVVAITFDDGPTPTGTPRVLDELARHGVKATFFLLGRNVEAHPELARAIVDRGHAIGNHTYSHPSLRRCSARTSFREFRLCQDSIRQATGLNPTIMRPPYGAQNVRAFLMARALGYQTVHWSTSGDDYRGDSAETIAQRIIRGISPGSVILLHDQLEPPQGQDRWLPGQEHLWDRTPTVEALSLLIPALRSNGYRFVTVPELLEAGRPITQRPFRSVTTTVSSMLSIAWPAL